MSVHFRDVFPESLDVIRLPEQMTNVLSMKPQKTPETSRKSSQNGRPINATSSTTVIQYMLRYTLADERIPYNNVYNIIIVFTLANDFNFSYFWYILLINTFVLLFK